MTAPVVWTAADEGTFLPTSALEPALSQTDLAGSQGFRVPLRGTLGDVDKPGTHFVVRSRRVVVDARIRPADVVITGDRIAGVVASDTGSALGSPGGTSTLVDVGELLVGPGLVDTQINGAGSVDLRRDPGMLASLCAEAASNGVTTLVATLPSHDLDADLVGELARATAAAASHPDAAPVASVAGLHLEGPFLAPTRAGAHRVEDLRPIDAEIIGAWARDPFVVMVTLAPELAGALDAIAVLTAAGTCVAIGHTEADVQQVRSAVDAGARHVTHLWNAMAGLHHRGPGVPGAALTDRRITAGLICDGAHVDPLVVALTWQAMGPERLVLVSDAVAGVGVSRPDEAAAPAVVAADGTLQGSSTMLDQGVRNLIAFTGSSVVDALGAATRTPAGLLGRRDLGVLASGARADLVVFDDDLVPVHVMIGGRWTSEPGAPT